MKNIASRTWIFPDGISRALVRGLRASIFLSIILFKPMAPDRAPTMATDIHNILVKEGIPFAASSAPTKANGRAKTECEIFIMRRYRIIFSENDSMVMYDTTGPAEWYRCLSVNDPDALFMISV